LIKGRREQNRKWGRFLRKKREARLKSRFGGVLERYSAPLICNRLLNPGERKPAAPFTGRLKTASYFSAFFTTNCRYPSDIMKEDIMIFR